MSKSFVPSIDPTEAREALLKLAPLGTTVYTILRHVSASGMQREISCHVIENGEPRGITHYVAALLGQRMVNNSHVALVVRGCGMDMGFHVVDSLASALYPTVRPTSGALTHRWL